MLRWRLRSPGAPREFSRTLVEAFLALGVGFGTLAIPLAADARWTGSAWALEGAGLVWLGYDNEGSSAASQVFFCSSPQASRFSLQS